MIFYFFYFVNIVQAVAQLGGTIFLKIKKSYYCRVMKNTVHGMFLSTFQKVVYMYACISGKNGRCGEIRWDTTLRSKWEDSR